MFDFTRLADSVGESSSYNSDKVTFDEHCYECKVRFRDPKPKDLMMFLHAWRYKVLVLLITKCYELQFTDGNLFDRVPAGRMKLNYLLGRSPSGKMRSSNGICWNFSYATYTNI